MEKPKNEEVFGKAGPTCPINWFQCTECKVAMLEPQDTVLSLCPVCKAPLTNYTVCHYVCFNRELHIRQLRAALEVDAPPAPNGVIH